VFYRAVEGVRNGHSGLDIQGQRGSLRGRWFRVVYRGIM